MTSKLKEVTPASAPQPTKAEDLLSRLSNKFESTANSKSVYGESIVIGGRVIVPVSKVSYFLGATSGGQTGDTIGGGAGGGHVSARPVGYIEITDETTRYVEYSAGKGLLAFLGLGALAGYLLCRLTSRR